MGGILFYIHIIVTKLFNCRICDFFWEKDISRQLVNGTFKGALLKISRKLHYFYSTPADNREL